MIENSIFLATRRDDWESEPNNFPIDRLRRSLDYILPNLHDTDECVLCDFGSDKPLSDSISHPRLKIAYVSPERAKKCGGGFSEVHAWNHCARIASGKWLVKTDGDVLIGKSFFSWLRNGNAKSGCFYFSNRRNMPNGQLEPSANDPIDYDGTVEYWKASTGILMVERGLWHKLRGCDEGMVHRQHVEHDLIVRCMRYAKLVDLGSAIRHPFHHQWHPRVGHDVRKQNKLRSTAELQQLPDVVNGENWGLADLLEKK